MQYGIFLVKEMRPGMFHFAIFVQFYLGAWTANFQPKQEKRGFDIIRI